MKIKAALQGIVVCAVVLLAAIMFTTWQVRTGTSKRVRGIKSFIIIGERCTGHALHFCPLNFVHT